MNATEPLARLEPLRFVRTDVLEVAYFEADRPTVRSWCSCTVSRTTCTATST